MFYPFFRVGAGRAAVAQIQYEAGIVSGKAAELRNGHPGVAQKDFDLSNQHGFLSA